MNHDIKPPQTTTNHHKPLQTTTNHHKLPQTTTNHHKPLRTTTNHHEPLRTTTNHHKPLQTTTNHYKPPRTTTNHHKPLRTTTNHHKPLQTTTNHYKPPQTTMNHHNDPERALHKAIWLPCWHMFSLNQTSYWLMVSYLWWWSWVCIQSCQPGIVWDTVCMYLIQGWKFTNKYTSTSHRIRIQHVELKFITDRLLDTLGLTPLKRTHLFNEVKGLRVFD